MNVVRHQSGGVGVEGSDSGLGQWHLAGFGVALVSVLVVTAPLILFTVVLDFCYG